MDITRQVAAEERLSRLSLELMKEADERRRNLARELHDTVGARMAGLSASLAALTCAEGLDENVRKGLSRCQKQVQECATEIQTVSYLQHPLVIDEMGLGPAVCWYAKQFSQRAGVKLETEIPDSLQRLPLQTEIALYRIIQECLTNIQLHSGSKRALIRIDKPDENFSVEVRDYGKGFTEQQVGLGITGMRERMKELGGRLVIASSSEGTTVRALLPLANIENHAMAASCA